MALPDHSHRTQELEFYAYSTKDLSRPAVAENIVGLASGLASVPIEILDTRQPHDTWIINPDKAIFDEIYRRGDMAFRSSRRFSVLGVTQWKRYSSPQQWRRLSRKEGRAQNTVYLRLAKVLLTEVSQEVFAFLCEVATLVSANYAIGYNRSCGKYDHVFDTVSGLEVGLRDIYDINIFGPPYVDLIGRDRLLSLPDARVAELANGFVSVTPGPRGESLFCASKKDRDAIRQHLGEKYFTTDERQDDESSVAVRNIFGLFSALRSESGRFADESFRAEVRPVFDYSEMIAPD